VWVSDFRCRPPLPEKTVDDRVEVHCLPGFVDRAFFSFFVAATYSPITSGPAVWSPLTPFSIKGSSQWRRIEGTSPELRTGARLSLVNL
jgi:hypothetical protein